MTTKLRLIALTIFIVPSTTTALTLTALPADANPPTGECTSSYSTLNFDAVGQLPDGPLAQSIFPIVDSNNDGLVCYKPYPNGDHNGHYGNFVDDKAAPHT
jgi:hypothetical protein